MEMYLRGGLSTHRAAEVGSERSGNTAGQPEPSVGRSILVIVPARDKGHCWRGVTGAAGYPTDLLGEMR